jgi:hypothetical protein
MWFLKLPIKKLSLARSIRIALSPRMCDEVSSHRKEAFWYVNKLFYVFLSSIELISDSRAFWSDSFAVYYVVHADRPIVLLYIASFEIYRLLIRKFPAWSGPLLCPTFWKDLRPIHITISSYIASRPSDRGICYRHGGSLSLCILWQGDKFAPKGFWIRTCNHMFPPIWPTRTEFPTINN